MVYTDCSSSMRQMLALSFFLQYQICQSCSVRPQRRLLSRLWSTMGCGSSWWVHGCLMYFQNFLLMAMSPFLAGSFVVVAVVFCFRRSLQVYAQGHHRGPRDIPFRGTSPLVNFIPNQPGLRCDTPVSGAFHWAVAVAQILSLRSSDIRSGV